MQLPAAKDWQDRAEIQTAHFVIDSAALLLLFQIVDTMRNKRKLSSSGTVRILAQVAGGVIFAKAVPPYSNETELNRVGYQALPSLMLEPAHLEDGQRLQHVSIHRTVAYSLGDVRLVVDDTHFVKDVSQAPSDSRSDGGPS